MDELKQDGQLEPIYKSSLSIRDIILKTYRWTIETGDERGSGIYLLETRYDALELFGIAQTVIFSWCVWV